MHQGAGQAAQTSLAHAPKRFPYSHLFDALLSRRGVLAYWGATALAFALARFAASRTLTLDEARTVEMAQEFAAGYTARQPPIYDQASWLLEQLLGSGAGTQLTLRFFFVALIGLFLFVAVARATASERYGAAASLSLGFHYFFGWNHHHWGTHTLVLCVAALWSYVALLDVSARPAAGRAVLLGLAIGLGVMAKFSFLLFLAALFLAALTLPELRAALRPPWIAIAGMTALAVCTPYIAWLAGTGADVLGTVHTHLTPARQSHFVRALTGIGLLLGSLVVFMLPWLLIIAILAPRAFDPRVTRDRAPTLGERLAMRTTVVAVALAAIGIVAIGATNIADRYMHPLLVLAPVIVFGRMAGIDGTAARLPAIAFAAVVATLVLLALRLSLPVIRPRSYLPYEALTREMSARGYDAGTAITVDPREAGNLRSFLPRLRVLAQLDSHRALRAPHRSGSRERCFIVWRLSEPPEGADAAAALVPPFASDVLAPAGRAPVVIEVPAPSRFLDRRIHWAIMDLAADSAACR